MLDLWKLLAAIFVLTLTLSQAAVGRQETGDRLSLTGNERLTRNSKLELLIDSFRDVMRNGNDSLRIPVLDPYEADKLIIKLDEDCLTINNKLSNIRMDGLANYTIDTATFSLLRMRIRVALTWPILPISTEYDIEANSGVLPIYGSGTIKLNAKNVTFSSVTTVAVNSELSVYVRSFTSKLALEALDFTITGLYNSEKTSELTSTIVSDNAPQVVEKYQEILTGRLNIIIVDRMNKIFNNMSLSDFINIIT
ncbi:uncharacterized protein LOC107274787 [Cephus cinctus]|uniref:Uncharacterized protein LOC107274787 n=1 Tax=Cephus cinctus TaxID=211228 RepID=A0AAJ7CG56_CEPCN|nr:uncharacterized protein LOC107274787 [Cephus cinctus]